MGGAPHRAWAEANTHALNPRLCVAATTPDSPLQSIVAQDGVSGLFTRGLTTRIAANALQNVFFTVLWNLVCGDGGCGCNHGTH
jgi:hypothetical protein